MLKHVLEEFVIMHVFECKLCRKLFKQKSDLTRHLKRKYPCGELDNASMTHSEEKDNSFACKHCGKEMKHYQSRWRHERKCKNKVDSVGNLITLLNEEHEREKEKWLQERKQMKEQIQLLLEKLTAPQVTHNHNNTYIVNVNHFGHEDMSYISQNYIQRLLKHPCAAVPELIKHIHFNPQHPENRSIKITNRKARFAEVFVNSGWQLMRKQDILDKIVDRGCSILDTCFDDQKSLTEDKQKQYKEFQANMDDDDSKVRKRTLQDTEMLVLNYSKDSVKIE